MVYSKIVIDHSPMVPLHEAIATGGIFYGIEGNTRSTVLQSAVAAIPLPSEFDRQFLYQVLLAREAIGSTCVGSGVAIPHPRHPVVLPVDKPQVSLCFLKRPIRYSPGSRELVHALCILISPTVRNHLRLLAHLVMALKDEDFLDHIREQSAATLIVGRALAIDATLSRRTNQKGFETEVSAI